jgi:hypothetical protein
MLHRPENQQHDPEKWAKRPQHRKPVNEERLDHGLSLGSRLKRDTFRPEGIGCCYGKPLQTLELRGTRRNLCRTSTGLKPA